MSLHNLNILMLDDEPFMLKLLGRILANLGYSRVSACDNGLAALKMVESPDESPDLILLDLNMPGMDGLEFVRHLVGRRFNGSLILVSGEDERMQQAAEKLAEAHNISVLGHLHKPASPGDLVEMIGSWSAPSPGKPRVEKKSYRADELRAAIRNGELVNHYQPKVWIATGKVMGVETLVRWQHPVDGIVFPDQFISLAEEHGLIDDLTHVVLSNALDQARRWQDEGLGLLVSINLSVDNLSSPEYADMIIELAANAGVHTEMIELEVTESRLMQDLRIPLEVLTRLRLKRFRLSIDDFGIGNSSLAQLRDLPFDELKIDQSFVRGACKNERLQAMFQSCLGLAKQLEMQAVAEGVEDRADWDFVSKADCDIAQGYFIARAMPAADLSGWIREWESRVHEELLSAPLRSMPP